MDTLKKIFPFAFAPKADALALIVQLILHLAIPMFVGYLLALLGGLSVVLAWICTMVISLLGCYFLISLLLLLLDYWKLFK